MKVLLTEGAEGATSETILVLPQASGATLETLAGDPVEKGVVTEAGEKAVASALNVGAGARSDEFVSAKDLQKDVLWLNKALAEYELGSRIGLKVTPRGFTLDDTEAKRIDRAKGLAKGDLVAIGPTVSPRTYMNARGRVVSISGEKVGVELDAGDRDRVERATGKKLPERTSFPRICVEKVEGGS